MKPRKSREKIKKIAKENIDLIIILIITAIIVIIGIKTGQSLVKEVEPSEYDTLGLEWVAMIGVII